MKNNIQLFLVFFIVGCLTFGKGGLCLVECGLVLCSIILFFLTEILTLKQNRVKCLTKEVLKNPYVYFVLLVITILLFQYFNKSGSYVKLSGIWMFCESDCCRFLPSSITIAGSENNGLFYLLCSICVLLIIFTTSITLIKKEHLIIFSWIVVILTTLNSFGFILYTKFGYNLFNAFYFLERLSPSGTYPYHPHGNVYYMISMAYAFLLVVYYVAIKKHKLLIFTLFFSIAIMYLAVLASNGFGGIIISTITILLFSIYVFLSSLQNKKWNLSFGKVIVVMTTILFFGCIYSHLFATHNYIEEVSELKEQGLEKRMNIQKINRDIVKTGGDFNVLIGKKDLSWGNLIYGRGVGSYVMVSQFYFISNKNFQKNRNSDIYERYEIPNISHSNLMGILIECGIIGFLLYVCLFVFISYKAFSINKHNQIMYPLLQVFLFIALYSVFDNAFDNLFIIISLTVLLSLQRNTILDDYNKFPKNESVSSARKKY